jgi:hypothetical protein
VKRIPLPPARPVVYPMRSLETAVTDLCELPGHRRRMTIDHRPLRGVTPEMLLWWFQNIGGTMQYAGQEVSNYHAWHPIDHIRWELARPAPGGGAREGARYRIVEAFQGRPEYYVDTVDRVEKLDQTGIRLVRRFAGVQVLQLSHTWSAAADSTHYVSVLEIGALARVFTPVNRYLNQHRFPEAMARAWLLHNVQEVGLLEQLLPIAYAKASDEAASRVLPQGKVETAAGLRPPIG